jgi:hypothetical protein
MPAKGADIIAKRGVLTGNTGVVVEIRSHVDEGWSRFEVLTGLPRKRGTFTSGGLNNRNNWGLHPMSLT